MGHRLIDFNGVDEPRRCVAFPASDRCRRWPAIERRIEFHRVEDIGIIGEPEFCRRLLSRIKDSPPVRVEPTGAADMNLHRMDSLQLQNGGSAWAQIGASDVVDAFLRDGSIVGWLRLSRTARSEIGRYRNVWFSGATRYWRPITGNRVRARVLGFRKRTWLDFDGLSN